MSTRGLGTVSTNPMVPRVSRIFGVKKAVKTWPGFMSLFFVLVTKLLHKLFVRVRMFDYLCKSVLNNHK